MLNVTAKFSRSPCVLSFTLKAISGVGSSKFQAYLAVVAKTLANEVVKVKHKQTAKKTLTGFFNWGLNIIIRIPT
ncbi:MAG: hypothetical protein ACFE9L_00200 [Candidatus Hodarchaeota archaeon]